MITKAWALGVGILVTAASAANAYDEGIRPDTCYGTAVSWSKSVKRAAERARTTQKLVLVVHLAGELDDAEKT